MSSTAAPESPAAAGESPRGRPATGRATGRVAPVPYRCVCGGTAAVRPAHGADPGGGDCRACGRRFAASVLDDGAATVSLPSADWLREAFAGGVLPDSPAWEPTAPAADPDATVMTGDLPGPPGGAGGRGGAPAPRPADLPPGAELEHFRVERLLGRGGMGAVYRALDLSLERYVALKVIRPDAARSKSTPAGTAGSGGGGAPGAGSGSVALDRLMQEARAQARVNHPNVAHIYFVSPDPADPFLAMELIDGPTLSQVLRDGPLPYELVSRVGLQIARALACAGRFDIVHGDVKPSNALLAGPPGDRAGSVKLSDFGLARRAGGAARGVLEGTPNYLAPEVVRGGTTTAKSDLYALGVTLFEATFGRLPYTTEKQGLTDRLTAHLSAPPEFPEPWPKRLPPDWRELLEDLLAKDPADRPADAGEVADRIARLAPRPAVRAGLLVRGLGWGGDLFLVSVASAMLLGGVAVPGFMLIESRLVGFAAVLAGVPLAALAVAAGWIPPLVLAWRQARTGRTPGKSLFQIRVVDRYGLKPDRRTLFLRGIAQTLLVWGSVMVGLTEELTGLGWPETGLEAAVLGVWLIDHLPALVRRDRRTLHDWLLGTRVVLDAAPPERRGED